MLSGFTPAEGYTSQTETGELPGSDASSVCDAGANGQCHYMLRSAEEEAILRDLVRDGISRGMQAWGKERFRKEACQEPELEERNSFTPIVLKELAKFCVDQK